MNEAYYILVNGEQTGPYTLDELIEKEPGLHTRIMAPSENTWQDACDVPELFEYFREQEYYFPTEDNLASFGWRLAAFCIDFIILWFSSSALIYVLILKGVLNINLQKITPYTTFSRHDMIIIGAIYYSLFILYNSICDASQMKGSAGKRICGLAVVNADGDGINYGIALVRSIAKLASVNIFWGIGTLTILWTEHKQALHDFLAKTYVVRKNV